MLWGETPEKHLYYAIGGFDGDGPNRPNQDNRVDATLRVFLRPFATSPRGPKDAQIGFSARWGEREASLMTRADGREMGRDIYNATTACAPALTAHSADENANASFRIFDRGEEEPRASHRKIARRWWGTISGSVPTWSIFAFACRRGSMFRVRVPTWEHSRSSTRIGTNPITDETISMMFDFA